MTQTARATALAILSDLSDRRGFGLGDLEYDDPEIWAEIVEAVSAPIVAYGNARIEDAAKVADRVGDDEPGGGDLHAGMRVAAYTIASAIRSLATKEGEET